MNPTLEALKACREFLVDMHIVEPEVCIADSIIVLEAVHRAIAALQPEQGQEPSGDWEAEFEAWWERHGCLCRSGGGDYEKTFAYRAYEEALKRQPTPPAEQWVSVKERLPEVQQGGCREFQIAVKYAGNKYVVTAHYLNGMLLQTDDDECPEEGAPFTGWHRERNDDGDYDTCWKPIESSTEEVTHWAPLLAPPLDSTDAGGKTA